MRIRRPAGLFLLLVYTLRSFAGGVTVEQLRADRTALDAARLDYQQRAESLSRGELEDYRDYIERLRRRFAADCGAVRQADGIVPPDIGCPDVVLDVAPAAIDQRSERTHTEATATLDGELDVGLGEFDQRLLREQERLKAKATKSAGGGASGTGGDGGASSAGGGANDSASDTGGTAGRDTASSGTSVEQPPGKTAGAAGQQGGGAPPPPDISSGRDDDIVARQLREAAEKETDPELRKKLWDEYRRYKQGVR